MKKQIIYPLVALLIMQSLSLFAQTSNPFMEYRWINPTISSNSLHTIDCDGDMVMVGGDNGFVSMNKYLGFSYPGTINTAHDIIGIFFGSNNSNACIFDEDGNVFFPAMNDPKKIGVPNVEYNKVAFDKVKNQYWMVGEKGNYSKGVEQTWQKAKITGLDEDLTAAFFINGMGYFGTDKGTICVTDGSSWTKQTVIADKKIHDIAFADENHGFAVCEYGNILIYNSSSKTWATKNLGITEHLNAIYFLDANNGYIVGDMGTIFMTKDAGTTWTNVDNPDVSTNLYAVKSNAAGDVYIAGAYGTLLVIEKANSKINILSKSVTSTNINSITSSNSTAGIDNFIAVGNNNTILYRKYNDNTLYKTKLADKGSSLKINTVAAISEQVAFLGTDDGQVYKTLNGGETWANIGIDNKRSIKNMKFKKDLNSEAYMGIFVGDKNLIYTTHNSGKNWVATSANINKDINAVDFHGDIAVAVGDKGHIIVSSNKGETWMSISEQINAPIDITTVDFNAVAFANIGNLIYVGGDKGILAQFNMATNEIKIIDLQTTKDITSIEFDVFGSKGSITTEGGEVYVTHNGGNTWQKANSYTSTSINAACIKAYDHNTIIYLCGNMGNIMSYTLISGSVEGNDLLPMNTISFYPNPASEILNIEKTDISKAEIYDINYKLLASPAVQSNGNTSFINIQNIASGSYILKLISSEGGAEYIKFIKQ